MKIRNKSFPVKYQRGFCTSNKVRLKYNLRVLFSNIATFRFVKKIATSFTLYQMLFFGSLNMALLKA
jgi:hypothetical protein